MVGQKVLGLRHQHSLRHGTRLIIVRKQETHMQTAEHHLLTAELVLFLYVEHILCVFEQFKLMPVFKNDSQGPNSCFFPINRNLLIPMEDLWES